MSQHSDLHEVVKYLDDLCDKVNDAFAKGQDKIAWVEATIVDGIEYTKLCFDGHSDVEIGFVEWDETRDTNDHLPEGYSEVLYSNYRSTCLFSIEDFNSGKVVTDRRVFYRYVLSIIQKRLEAL